jgi:hypothetical protein
MSAALTSAAAPVAAAATLRAARTRCVCVTEEASTPFRHAARRG